MINLHCKKNHSKNSFTESYVQKIQNAYFSDRCCGYVHFRLKSARFKIQFVFRVTHSLSFRMFSLSCRSKTLIHSSIHSSLNILCALQKHYQQPFPWKSFPMQQMRMHISPFLLIRSLTMGKRV